MRRDPWRNIRFVVLGASIAFSLSSVLMLSLPSRWDPPFILRGIGLGLLVPFVVQMGVDGLNHFWAMRGSLTRSRQPWAEMKVARWIEVEGRWQLEFRPPLKTPYMTSSRVEVGVWVDGRTEQPVPGQEMLVEVEFTPILTWREQILQKVGR